MSGTALLICLPVALVGLYYAVNAGGGTALQQAEGERANRVRGRLRRANGLVMVALSVVGYVAVSRTFPAPPDGKYGLAAPLAWLATLPLLLVMVLLALLDARLTRSLRKELNRRAAVESAKREALDKGEREWAEAEARKWREASERAARVVIVAVLLGVIGCERPGNTTRPTTTAPAVQSDPEPDRDARAQRLPTTRLVVAGKTFDVQVADEEIERETGLMFRKKMADDEGMLFVFPDAERRGFWMKNTLVPLDILYLDEEMRVLNVEQMAAQDLRSTPSRGRAKYALETPLNGLKSLNLRPGQVVELPESAREAADE